MELEAYILEIDEPDHMITLTFESSLLARELALEQDYPWRIFCAQFVETDNRELVESS